MDEKMVSLRINDIPVTVPEGSTAVSAAAGAAAASSGLAVDRKSVG